MIGPFVHSRVVQSDRTGGAPRALLYEGDPVICERARLLLRADGHATCAVDTWDVFERLRAAMSFDVYVVGVGDTPAAPILDALREVSPLIVLAPLASERLAHLRMAGRSDNTAVAIKCHTGGLPLKTEKGQHVSNALLGIADESLVLNFVHLDIQDALPVSH